MNLEQRILWIIDNSHNDSWLSRKSHVPEPVINKYRHRDAKITNMTLGTAEKILNVFSAKKD